MRRSPLRALALAIPLFGLAGAASIVVGFSVDGGAVAGALVSLPIVATVAARRAQGPAGGIVAACAALGYALPLWLGCMSSLSEPIAGSSWICGTGGISLFFVIMLASLFGSVGFGALGAAVAHLAKGRRGELGLRIVAATAIAALLAMGAVLALHSGRESRATYLSTLSPVPVWNVVKPIDTEGTFISPQALDPWDSAPVDVGGASFVVQHRVGEGVTTVDRAPHGVLRSCTLVVTRGAIESRRNVAYYGAERPDELCPDLRVRWVRNFEGHDAFVVEQTFSLPRHEFVPTMVLDGATLEPTTLTIESVPDAGPPRAWLAGIFAAAAAALASFVASARRRPVAPSGLEGQHKGDGWVRFGDAPPRFFEDLVATPEGPVVLRGRHFAASYRTDGGPAHDATPIRGTLATLAAEALQARAVYSCLAITAALLGLAPLIACAFYGVL